MSTCAYPRCTCANSRARAFLLGISIYITLSLFFRGLRLTIPLAFPFSFYFSSPFLLFFLLFHFFSRFFFLLRFLFFPFFFILFFILFPSPRLHPFLFILVLPLFCRIFQCNVTRLPSTSLFHLPSPCFLLYSHSTATETARKTTVKTHLLDQPASS